MKKITMITFLFFIFMVTGSLGADESYIAKAEIIKGKVSYALKSDKKEQPVKVNQKFVTDTIIKTSKQSSITIKFKNGSLMEVKENSKVVLNKVLLDKSSVSLLQGSGKFKIQKLLKNTGEFNVYTPTAVVGVRGTDYELGVAPDGSVGVNVSDGKVAVNNDSQGVALTKNESTVASLGNDKLTKDAGLKDLNEVNKAKESEMDKNPVNKLNAISSKFDGTLTDQQALVNKLADTKNTNAGADVNKGLFNEAKTEGLITVANNIKDKNPQDKLVSNVYTKINSLYDRLNKLNQIMDEKFNNLDKIYQKKEEDLMKKLEDKQKLFDQKFKDFGPQTNTTSSPNK